jgi:predicted DNA-binding transcriptional regulator AlpA
MSSKPTSQPTSSTMPATNHQTILTPKQAAAVLNLSTSWLAKQRLKGGGPPYIKMGGAVRYNASILQEWMRGKQRLSTSGT